MLFPEQTKRVVISSYGRLFSIEQMFQIKLVIEGFKVRSHGKLWGILAKSTFRYGCDVRPDAFFKQVNWSVHHAGCGILGL
jgi:hypothetical protein